MDKRVMFDFEIYFTNGGSIKGEDFRLDINGEDISDKELADYIVADMHLLMVGQTKILHKEILHEKHKRQHIDVKIENEVFIDLSHVIESGLITYKGLPAPIICDYLSREDSKKFYEEGTEFQIGKIEMVSNTGTYIDCPFHRFENGKDLSEIGLESFADLEGIVIRVPYKETLEITADHLKNYEVRNRAVLINTGWDEHWNTDNYYTDHPYLTKDAAEYLRDCSVKLVGIDSHNIDNTNGKSRPVHTTLLGAEILIVEHLCNLYLLPQEGFLFSAIPPKFKGVGTFPVRAMAKIAKAK
ncbi:cyclase family protein [Panacibacter ginsenosidivorans]|uniref:Cyclase family protein n=1 Tax=Panacibacter ginsenosidivorans TaxID=1813871 RepID=A0A5B8V6J9_9BACT|nr:cyclase family protein [Panacibacter ginsenosidivorans]QEC67090.1 cyclase family protein [Panacibacter ginsenosidivorans]